MVWWFQVSPSAINCHKPLPYMYLGPVISAELTNLWSSHEIWNWSPISIMMYYCLTAQRLKKLVAKASEFPLIDGILIYLGCTHKGRQKVVVPLYLRESILCDSHGGSFGGHFAGLKLYNTLSRKWWWCYCLLQKMSWMHDSTQSWMPTLTTSYTESCLQKIGVDVMDLSCTEHVAVKDMFTKRPLVFPVTDQRSEKVLLDYSVKNLSPCLVSQRLQSWFQSFALHDAQSLQVAGDREAKYNPECDVMIERFNRILKTMLRKRAAQFGNQWDKHLPRLLWGYPQCTWHYGWEALPLFYCSDGIADLPLRLHCYQWEPTSIEDYTGPHSSIG